MRIQLLTLILASHFCHYLLAQTPFKKGFDPKHPIKELGLDTWSNKNGLVSNNIKSIYQSKDDFLWLTSYNGLQKFDGGRFELFDQSTLQFLNSNTVNQITETDEGVLYFCTQSSGVFKYDGQYFNPISQNDQIPKAISSIHYDRKGRTWLGSKNNGLYVIEKTGNVYKEMGIPDLTVFDIAEDKEGNIWLASDGQGTFKISDDTIKNYTTRHGLSENLTTSVFCTDDGSTLVGTTNGLNRIDSTGIKTYDGVKGIIVNDVITDDFGSIWVGSERGILRIAKDRKIEILTTKQGLPGNRIMDLFFDNEGSLWIGTYQTGLARLKQSIITNLTIRDGLSTNQTYIIKQNNDAFYIGSQDGIINVFNGDNIDHITMDKRFREDVIRDIEFVGNEIWVANYMGLARIFKNGKIKYYHEGNGLPNNSLRRILKTKDGVIWLASRAGGIVQFDIDGNHKVYDKTNGLNTNYVMSMFEDKDGNILAGTNGGGLSIISKSGDIQTFNLKGDDSGTVIFDITYADNFYWICSNLGLYQFDGKQFKKIIFNENLTVQKFFDLIIDHENNYWLTSSIGLIKVKNQELQSYTAGEMANITHEHFGREDGMESQECTGATQAYHDQQTGKIWVPTFEGVAIINSTEKLINKKTPHVFITGMQVDNIAISPINDKLIIQPGTFRYLFDITSLSYLAPSKVQFKYKLEGIDEEWNGPILARKIEYTNLPYGDYSLHVIASNNDDVWNTNGASLSFTVKPFYFETLWFRIGFVLLIIGTFYAFYRWRIHDIRKTNKALTKMNKELDKFVYSASHDLRGPLTSTMGIVQLATSREATTNKDQYFHMIKDCTDKMDHFINELINYARNKNDLIQKAELDFEVLIDDVIEDLQPESIARGVRIEKDINQKIVTKSDEGRLKVIIKYLLHNAIIFSSGQQKDKFAKISLNKHNSNAQISIEDNGIGISDEIRFRVFNMFFRGNEQSIGSGLGLYVVKDTCDKLGAQIDMMSEPGQGSRFVVTLP